MNDGFLDASRTETEASADDASASTSRPAPSPARAALAKAVKHPLLNVALLLATLATTTWAGAAYQGVSLWRDPGHWTVGLPYALAVLFILGVHEMGHYVAARCHGVRVSLPYFLPMPFALGTLGAFIRMEHEPSERRKLFDIAIAGPVAGLAAALAAFAVALLFPSSFGASAAPAVDPSSSMLLAFLTDALGRDVASVATHPLAFAGWLGVVLTAFNLLPIGQLDGGHMTRALFGARVATRVGWVALAVMVLLGVLVWHGFLLWALVAYAVGGGSSADDAEPGPATDRILLDVRRHALGLAALGLLVLILVPMPVATPEAVTMLGCPWA